MIFLIKSIRIQHCYSGGRKTLFHQISKQSEHTKQNDRQNSNANQRDPVRNVIVVSLDCTLVVKVVDRAF